MNWPTLYSLCYSHFDILTIIEIMGLNNNWRILPTLTLTFDLGSWKPMGLFNNWSFIISFKIFMIRQRWWERIKKYLQKIRNFTLIFNLWYWPSCKFLSLSPFIFVISTTKPKKWDLSYTCILKKPTEPIFLTLAPGLIVFSHEVHECIGCNDVRKDSQTENKS